MTRRQEITRGLVVLAVFVLAALWLSKCQGDDWNAERKLLLDTADSLVDKSRIDSVLAARRVDSLSEIAARATERAEKAVATADILRAQRRAIQPVAGQPGAAPTVSDTLAAVDSSLTLCDEETAVLRAALDFNRQAVKAGELAVTEMKSALSLETASSAALRVTVVDLSRKLASADPPCRIAFWACPSRTTVAVGSAIGATVLTLTLKR